MKLKQFTAAFTASLMMASCVTPQPVYAGGFSSRSTSSSRPSTPAKSSSVSSSKSLDGMGYQARASDVKKPPVVQNSAVVPRSPVVQAPRYSTSPSYSNNYPRTYSNNYYSNNVRQGQNVTNGHSTGTVAAGVLGGGILGYMLGKSNNQPATTTVAPSVAAQNSPQAVNSPEVVYPTQNANTQPVAAPIASNEGRSLLGTFFSLLVGLLSWVLQISLILAIIYGIYRGIKWVWNKYKNSSVVVKAKEEITNDVMEAKEMFNPKTKEEKLVKQHYAIFSTIQENADKENYYKAVQFLTPAMIHVYTEYSKQQEPSGAHIQQYRSENLGSDDEGRTFMRYTYRLDGRDEDDVYTFVYNESTGKYQVDGITSYADFING